MATTTTNFNFPIPQSTDLVKDGATAIAALGTSIDTDFVDLKGGTTGQVLSKASGTDLDFTWVAQDDSNAIQNAIVDAKGDLIAATAADTPARLAVGTNGQVLTADSTAATGLAWATASSGIPATILDAKGDLIAATAADTAARLAVGSNTQVLMADSTAATGLKWGGDWTSYTPTLGGITIGNGSREGRYMQIGKTIIFSMRLVFGSTSSITGTPSMDLPVSAKITQFFTTGEIEDAGTTRYGIMGQVVANSATVYLYVGNVTGTYLAGSLISSSIPMTWTTNDVYTIAGTYEVA